MKKRIGISEKTPLVPNLVQTTEKDHLQLKQKEQIESDDDGLEFEDIP